MSRTALVTGGTRGIGAAISIALKDAGFAVCASYGGNDEAAKAFKKSTAIPVYKFDVSDFSSCEVAIARITAEIGAIDVLVNNAGITRDGMLHKMSLEHWNAVINTNLNSMFNTTKNVIGPMRERGFGRIINISSINGQKGQMGQTNYSAAKAGVIGFTKALAQEGARKGITVNCIAPGYVATDMVKDIPEDVLNSKILPQIPVGRLAEPAEIARCVTFLASDDAGYITGATLTVNGGQYITT